jgi:hypothetical protein
MRSKGERARTAGPAAAVGVTAVILVGGVGCGGSPTDPSGRDSAAHRTTASISPSSSLAPLADPGSVVASGRYATPPLSAAKLRQAGLLASEVDPKDATVYTLQLSSANYILLERQDGGDDQEGDAGTWSADAKTMTFVSSGDGARSVYRLDLISDGFQLTAVHLGAADATSRRIAKVVWTTAPYHRLLS